MGKQIPQKLVINDKMLEASVESVAHTGGTVSTDCAYILKKRPKSLKNAIISSICGTCLLILMEQYPLSSPDLPIIV